MKIHEHTPEQQRIATVLESLIENKIIKVNIWELNIEDDELCFRLYNTETMEQSNTVIWNFEDLGRYIAGDQEIADGYINYHVNKLTSN